MYSRTISSLFLTISLISVVTFTSLKAGELTPNQLDATLKATQQAYKTLVVDYNFRAYIYDANHNEKLIHIGEVTWKRDKSRQYCEVKSTDFDKNTGNIRHVKTSKASLLPGSMIKKIESSKGEERSRALIKKPTGPLDPEMGAPVTQALWYDQFSHVLNHPQSNLNYTDESRQYQITGPALQAGVTFEGIISAETGFLPIEQKETGTVVFKTTFSDFRKVTDALWLPYQYIQDIYDDQGYLENRVVYQIKTPR
jgi:hypothetical protein